MSSLIHPDGPEKSSEPTFSESSKLPLEKRGMRFEALFFDLDETSPALSEYKNLAPEWHDGRGVKAARAHVAKVVFDRVCKKHDAPRASLRHPTQSDKIVRQCRVDVENRHLVFQDVNPQGSKTLILAATWAGTSVAVQACPLLGAVFTLRSFYETFPAKGLYSDRVDDRGGHYWHLGGGGVAGVSGLHGAGQGG